MVKCHLCKGKLRVTRDKHLYDEKLKKRYHLKCFAGICRECDMPVYSKAKHKTIGSNVWHEQCYKKMRARANPKQRALKTPPPPPKERKLKLPPPPPRERKLKRKNPVKTIKDSSWKAMTAARKAAGVPKTLWKDFERAHFKGHPPEFEEDNPGRPTKEFWDKTYPGVLAGYKKKYPKTEAEERARKTTASIWYGKMSPGKKQQYERIRRKREARENPHNHDAGLKRTLKKDLTRLMADARYLLVRLGGHGAAKMVEFQSLRPAAIQEGVYSVRDTPQAREMLERLGISYTPYRMPRADIDRLMEDLFAARENPMLVTPDLETDIVGAFKRVAQGVGTESDKTLVKMAREADVIMSTGPSILLKHNPEVGDLIDNPEKLDYIIQDEFGTVFETGKGTASEAEARALVYNRRHMREFKVVYPKKESAEVRRAAETATREMLKD